MLPGGLYSACIGYENISKQKEVETWKGAPRGVQMGHFLTLFFCAPPFSPAFFCAQGIKAFPIRYFESVPSCFRALYIAFIFDDFCIYINHLAFLLQFFFYFMYELDIYPQAESMSLWLWNRYSFLKCIFSDVLQR